MVAATTGLMLVDNLYIPSNVDLNRWTDKALQNIPSQSNSSYQQLQWDKTMAMAARFLK